MSVARSSGAVAAASAAQVERRRRSSSSAAGCTPSGRSPSGGSMTKIVLAAAGARRGPSGTARGTRVLDDRDLGLGVAGQVLDLLGRRRVVDAHRRGPQELGRGVEPVEVGPVAHHQQHPLARLDARACCRPAAAWATRSAYSAARPLVPRARLLASHRAEQRRGPDGRRRGSRKRCGAVCPATAWSISSIGPVGGHRRRPYPADAVHSTVSHSGRRAGLPRLPPALQT